MATHVVTIPKSNIQLNGIDINLAKDNVVLQNGEYQRFISADIARYSLRNVEIAYGSTVRSERDEAERTLLNIPHELIMEGIDTNNQFNRYKFSNIVSIVRRGQSLSQDSINGIALEFEERIKPVLSALYSHIDDVDLRLPAYSLPMIQEMQPLSIGNKSIAHLNLGNKSIAYAYFGDKKVFP